MATPRRDRPQPPEPPNLPTMTYSFAQQMPPIPTPRPSQHDLNFPSLPTNSPSPDAPRWPKPITAAEVVASSPTPHLATLDSPPDNTQAQLLLYSKLVPTASAVPRNPLRSIGGAGRLRSTGSVAAAAASKQPAPPPTREPPSSRMQSLSSGTSRPQLARRVANHQQRSPAAPPAPPRRLDEAFARERDVPKHRDRDKADVPPGFETPRRLHPREERELPPANARAEAFREAISTKRTPRPPRRLEGEEGDRAGAKRSPAEREARMIKIMANRTGGEGRAAEVIPGGRRVEEVVRPEVRSENGDDKQVLDSYTDASERPRAGKVGRRKEGAGLTTMKDAKLDCSSLGSAIEGRSLQFEEDVSYEKRLNGWEEERNGAVETLVDDVLHAENEEKVSQTAGSVGTLSMIDMMCRIHAGSASMLLNDSDGEDVLLPPLPNPEEAVRFESLLRSMGWTPPDEDEGRVVNGQKARVGYYSHFP